MYHFSEEAFAGHLQCRQLEEIVAAVLQYHTVQAFALSHVDQRPAVFQGIGGRHFDSHMLAVLHGIEGHRYMVLPVGAYIYEVDIRIFAQLLEGFHAAGIFRSRREAALRKVFLRCLDAVRLDVADGRDFHPGDISIADDSVAAPHAESYEPHPDSFHRGYSQPQHVGLSRCAGRRRSHYRTLVVESVSVFCLVSRAASAENCKYDYQKSRSFTHGQSMFKLSQI